MGQFKTEPILKKNGLLFFTADTLRFTRLPQAGVLRLTVEDLPHALPVPRSRTNCVGGCSMQFVGFGLRNEIMRN
jgi:hypothetical protein